MKFSVDQSLPRGLTAGCEGCELGAEISEITGVRSLPNRRRRTPESRLIADDWRAAINYETSARILSPAIHGTSLVSDQNSEMLQVQADPV
jgi:hypothetical protein